MQATHLSALIHGMRNITPALAAKLEKGLPGITASFWLGHPWPQRWQNTKLHMARDVIKDLAQRLSWKIDVI